MMVEVDNQIIERAGSLIVDYGSVDSSAGGGGMGREHAHQNGAKLQVIRTMINGGYNDNSLRVRGDE